MPSTWTSSSKGRSLMIIFNINWKRVLLTLRIEKMYDIETGRVSSIIISLLWRTGETQILMV
jgi:hypothetical protein